MVRARSLAASCLFALPFFACAVPARRTSARPGDGGENVLNQALQAFEAEKQDYKIAPQDLLAISVYQEDDLKREIRVSEGGKVSFPLIGEVVVGGLTALQAEEKFKSLLKDYLVSPNVSVQIKEYHARRVFILGEVAKPGSYEIPSERALTVVEAIALAGGLTKIAAPDRTRVVRKAGGRSINFTVPVREITEGDKSKDVPVQPDDVVYVPQTFF